DVGELEGDAALHGQFLGRVAALEAPDVDARQSDDAGDPVAVCIKLVEGREGYGREVLLLAGDDFVEGFARDAIARGHVAEGGPELLAAVRRLFLWGNISGQGCVRVGTPGFELLAAHR